MHLANNRKEVIFEEIGTYILAAACSPISFDDTVASFGDIF